MSFFIPRGNLHLLIARMHSIFRYLLTLFVICLLTYCWYYFIHIPISTLLSNQFTQIHALPEKKAETKNYKSFDIEKAQRTEQQLKKEKEQLLINKKLMRENFLMHIIETARCTDLRIINCKNNIHKLTQNNNEATISLSMSGSYKQIMQFFKAICTNNIKCPTLQLRNMAEHEYNVSAELVLS